MFLKRAGLLLIMGALQLGAASQNVSDAMGVTVEANGSQFMHRVSVSYPREAIAKGIQGTVVVQVKLDDTGSVVDANVLSGPDELRKAVLLSVLNWHLTKDAALSTRQITVMFRLPATQPVVPTSVQRQPQTTPTIKGITVNGLSGQATEDLLSRLPVHEGDVITIENGLKLQQVVEAFDPHLVYAQRQISPGEALVFISLESPVAAPTTPASIRVGGPVIAANLLSKVDPVYPAAAKDARIQGTVKFNATIGKDGHIANLTLVSGHPLLVGPAQSAVSQWVYKPTLLNGNATDVITTIDVNFTLTP